MNTPTPPPDRPKNTSPAPRRRWLLYGVLIAACGLLLAGTTLFVGVRYGLNTFTSTKPEVLPLSTLSPADEDQLDQKLSAFSDRYEQGQDATLELSAPELNAVLAAHTSLSTRILIRMTGSHLHAQVSLPLDSVAGDQGRDRWLNGEATLAIQSQDGRVQLQVTAFSVNGRSLPHRLLEALRHVNLAAEAATHPTTGEYVRRVDRIAVEGDKLVIHFKAA